MKKWNNIIGLMCATMLLLMTIIGAMNAILRYSSKFSGVVLSLNAFLEAQWYLFSAIFLLGAGYTLHHNKHIRVDVLYGRLGTENKRRIDLIGTVLFLIPFCCFGIWSSWEFVFNSWDVFEMSPDAGGLPRYLVKSLIPIGFVFLLVQGFVTLYNLLQNTEKEDG